MSLRNLRILRAIARRLPILRQYEARLTQVNQRLAELEQTHATWVPIGHYYSPFVDVVAMPAISKRTYETSPTDVAGVMLRLSEQRSLLAEITPFASSVWFSQTEQESAREQGHRYWAKNPSYGDTDARFLVAMLRHFCPTRLIELGCGYSSAATLDARDRFLDFELDLTFVDPYPELLESLVRDNDRSTVSILPVGTQDVDLDLIRQLDVNDVLFIDSTHVSKAGSDVNRIFFEILPALRPGVLVHMHDIFARFEYPMPWVQENRAWTEQYLLRAFLQYNAQFEIVLWPNLLAILDPQLIVQYPLMSTNAGGAFWMRKVA